MRSALLELVTIRPEVNTSKFNNMSWASMRTERFVCIFYHLRRLKREEARLVQVAAKLTGQQLTKLKALLRQMELKGPEESGDSQSQGAKSSSQVQHASTSDLQEVAPSTSRVLKRKCSEVSVDSQGFPMMLRSPRQKASPLLQRSVLGEGEARARMRIHGKSPPINEEHCLQEALGFVPAGKAAAKATAKAASKAASKAAAKDSAKAAASTTSSGKDATEALPKGSAKASTKARAKACGAQAKAKAKGKAKAKAKPKTMAKERPEVEYEDEECEEEDEEEDAAELEESEKPACAAQPSEVAPTEYYTEAVDERAAEEQPFTSIKLVHAASSFRAYLTGVCKDKGSRTLIVEVSSKRVGQYLQMVTAMKAEIEEKHLDKASALALREEWIETGTYK